MPPADSTELPLGHALVLGTLQGPAELLPVSSSGHITLVPWLLRWPYPELDPELRKSFEVALHAGTALALLIGLRSEVGTAVRDFDGRRAALIALSFAPPAFVGYTWERPIERRLGTPMTIAVGLLLGSALMVWADRAPQERRREEAGAVDALCLGLAQACALMPGVSRNGATLAAARARGFKRRDANALSRHVALPIIVGAAALKGHRLWRRGLPPGGARAIAAGAGAAFTSTLASIKLIALVERDSALAPYAAYRTALAALVIRRVRQNGRT
jgi:undecaprenyl-diphosphatase